jgi:hypothetical protein
MGIFLGVSGFRVSALNRVSPFVRPSNILLARRLSDVWLDGRAEGRWVLSLTHTHTFIYMCKWVYLLGKVSKVIKLFPWSFCIILHHFACKMGLPTSHIYKVVCCVCSSVRSSVRPFDDVMGAFFMAEPATEKSDDGRREKWREKHKTTVG